MQPYINGKACHCAHHTHRQHLFYEFVNLDAAAMMNALSRVDFRFFGRFSVLDAPFMLLDVQSEGKLAQLWEAVKAEGGNLPGACPNF